MQFNGGVELISINYKTWGLLVICASFLIGCTAKINLYRTDGIIYKASCSGGVKCSYEGEDGKVELDSKFNPMQGLLQVGPGIKP